MPIKGTATVFGYRVGDPERYGVVEFDESGRGDQHEEKPVKAFVLNYAVVGLILPQSGRGGCQAGETIGTGESPEITSVNQGLSLQSPRVLLAYS